MSSLENRFKTYTNKSLIRKELTVACQSSLIAQHADRAVIAAIPIFAITGNANIIVFLRATKPIKLTQEEEEEFLILAMIANSMFVRRTHRDVNNALRRNR